jgi:N-acyl homoserine lactone hydrolase
MREMPRATSVRRLFVLLCGFEILPKTVSTRDRGGRFILSEPVCAYLLDTESGWVLLDTGLNADNGLDRERMRTRFWDAGMAAPVVRRDHLLKGQLAELGLAMGDIRHVILSHLHYDHCGNLPLLAHARISVQRREYEHAFGERPGGGYFRDEYDHPRLAWDLRDGDWQALPGLQLIDTRGHTPGHQSAVVTLPETGTVILPFDAGDLRENFAEEVLPGESCDDEAALRAIRRINTIAAGQPALVLLFHDPTEILRIRLSPLCYT